MVEGIIPATVCYFYPLGGANDESFGHLTVFETEPFRESPVETVGYLFSAQRDSFLVERPTLQHQEYHREYQTRDDEDDEETTQHSNCIHALDLRVYLPEILSAEDHLAQNRHQKDSKHRKRDDVKGVKQDRKIVEQVHTYETLSQHALNDEAPAFSDTIRREPMPLDPPDHLSNLVPSTGRPWAREASAKTRWQRRNPNSGQVRSGILRFALE